ncbi:MAG TPA: hypothetical protein VNO32_44440 [Candidatus Acidoferrum sp.]|jgi:hypothetical protein|nr:hypothetical protein [Candidatus Acidoferrum sp.]
MSTPLLPCDGCGQSASPEHIARRLLRLEWTTRYRPVHIGALLLGSVSPLAEEDFLYRGKFQGEAGRLLEALGISTPGKSPETVLSEFQKGGFFLAHVLECPVETSEAEKSSYQSLLAERVSQVLTRIRRSLKPKRVVLISDSLAPLAAKLSGAELGCPVILDNGKPFGLDSGDFSGAAGHLRQALGLATAGVWPHGPYPLSL